MEKIWVTQYEQGVPTEINPDRIPSLNQLLYETCEQFPDSIALSNYGSDLTYRQLDRLTRNFAAFCQQELKLQPGDRLAIMMPNVMQYFVALYGGLRAGLTIVNVNPLYTHDELVYLLNDSEAQAIAVVSNFATTVENALLDAKTLQHIIVTDLGDLFPWPKRMLFNAFVKYIKKMVPAWNIPKAIQLRDALEKGQKADYQEVLSRSDDIAFLQYTGGTTGIPKAAVLTHRNVLANVEQGRAWCQNIFTPGKEVIVTALPLYHIFSLTANGFLFLRLGAKNILITNPRDIPAFVKELKKQPITAITGVNTLFNALTRSKQFADVDFSQLKLTLAGGMAVQHEVAARWKKVTKCSILQAYGLTETSPAVTINPMNMHEFNGSIGLPLPSTSISIRDANGVELPIGESGELCVQGPQVMREYWHRQEETAAVFYPDHWLRTGDIAKVDEQGFVFIVDRLKDMIIVSGFKVYPNEVEDVIASMDGVLEAGVVGIKNEKGREIVTAFVVKTDPAIGQEEVINFCKQHLTNYKIPKSVHFVKDLPKSNVGKILRRELRAS